MKHILISNRWRTPDGTLLVSKYTHDFVSHQDANGDVYFVDGGNDYSRRSLNDIPMTNESVYADDDFEIVRQCLLRGTFGFDNKGTDRRIWMPMNKMSDAHLCNIIVYDGISDGKYSVYTHLYVKELIYRLENGLYSMDRKYSLDEPDKSVQYETVPAVKKIETSPKFDYSPNFEYVLDTISELSNDSKSDDVRKGAYFELKWLDRYLEKKYGESDEVYVFLETL